MRSKILSCHICEEESLDGRGEGGAKHPVSRPHGPIWAIFRAAAAPVRPTSRWGYQQRDSAREKSRNRSWPVRTAPWWRRARAPRWGCAPRKLAAGTGRTTGWRSTAALPHMWMMLPSKNYDQRPQRRLYRPCAVEGLHMSKNRPAAREQS